jgi:hypothetical protein
MPGSRKASCEFAFIKGLLTITVLISQACLAVGQNLDSEAIVSRHLDGLGRAETRNPNRSRIAGGSSLMTIRTGGRGQGIGPALIASQGDRVLLKAEFDSAAYPMEKLGFDGKRLYARPYAPGARSPLAGFLLSHPTTFSEGLIGGTLSSAWPLLDLSSRKAKLENDGTEKIAGRRTYRLKYIPHQGSELKIKLFFDAENFHHVRTEYERSIAAPIGATPGQSVSQREIRYKLIESYSDFRAEGALTLPHTYNLQFSVFRLNDPLLLDWTISLTKFTFDYPIQTKEFVTDN